MLTNTEGLDQLELFNQTSNVHRGSTFKSDPNVTLHDDDVTETMPIQ